MRYNRTFLAAILVFCVALSALPEFSPAMSHTYESKIDKNLQLEEGESYIVNVRIEWSPDLEPIKFKHDAVVSELKREAAETQEPIIAFLEQKGAKVLNTFWLDNLILIEADANTIWELATFPTVEKIFPNFEVRAARTQSEVGANTEFIVAGNSPTWNLEKVRAPEVWEKLGIKGENIRVATTDTGIDISHPEIAGTLYTEDPNDPTYPGGWIEYDATGVLVHGSVPHDPNGHGTATYGLILGQTTGMAPKAIGMHALVLDSNMYGTISQVLSGLEWVLYPIDQDFNPTNKPANVSCHSWGLPEGYKSYFVLIIRTMWLANHFVVASIGNDGEGAAGPPGEIYECIAVGATDADDNVWVDSSGRVIYKTEWSKPPADWPAQWVKPDLSAPGVNVIVPLPGNHYSQVNGTSFAAPHVAGAAVLMLSRNPSLPVQDIEDILKETAVWYDRYYSERPDTRYGWGRIDAYRAVSLAGFKARLIVPTEDVGGCHDIAIAIKKELAKVRIHIIIEKRTASEMADTVWGDYWDKTWDEAPGLGWDMTWYEFYGAAEDLTSYYMSDATPPEGGSNVMGWNNSRSDYLLTVLINETDPLLRQTYFWKWQEEYMWDMPGPVLYYLKNSPCCRGLAFNLHHPVLTNRYVRQAIAHAMPIQHIIQILDDWNIEALYGITPVHPTDPMFHKGLKGEYIGDNLDEARRLLAMWEDQTYEGDADFSGAVDLDDSLIWRKIAAGPNWNKPENWPWYPGDGVDPDFTNGGVVDLSDYTLWITNYGTEYWTIDELGNSNPEAYVLSAGIAEYPGIYIIPASTIDSTLTPGKSYTVSIYTDYTGDDVWGYEFTLTYNPLVLQGVSVTNGDLIVNGTMPGGYTGAGFIPGTFNNTEGKLSLTAADFYFFEKPANLTSGPGTLANVTFQVVGIGDSDIELGVETRLIGVTEGGYGKEYNIIDDITPEPGHILHGYFCNKEPAPIHDIAVVSVTSSPTLVGAGDLVSINVTVENQGTVAEIFEVNVYYDEYFRVKPTKTVRGLEAGENKFLSWTWDTTDVPEGNHTIKAVASTLPRETDTADNTYIDGAVTVASWLSGWSYRKSHVITSASGAGTNYQVKVKAYYYGNGTDSGENVYLNSHSRTDFGDVRFTNGNGITELDYWMEEKFDGDYAIFWVEVADDLSSSNQTIYIYYGKSDANTTSDLSATATELYSFEGSLNGWTVENTMTEASFTNEQTYPYDGSWDMKQWSRYASVNQYCRLKKDFSSGRKFYYWVRREGPGLLSGYKAGGYWIGTTFTEQFRDDGQTHPYTKYSFSFTGSRTIRIGQRALKSFGPYNTKWYYDYFYTFKNVSPEPSHGNWGQEEKI